MGFRALDTVEIAWGASCAVDHVVEVDYISKNHKGMQARALRTVRGHLVLQSYSTPVFVAFNYYNSNVKTVCATLWGSSNTTSKQMCVFRYAYSLYGEEALPSWYVSSREDVVWADTYVGDHDPFNPSTWADKEILRVSKDEFAAGKTIQNQGGIKLQQYVDYHGRVRYQVYNNELLRLKRFKYEWKHGGFDSAEEALESVPEKFYTCLSIQRLKHAA